MDVKQVAQVQRRSVAFELNVSCAGSVRLLNPR